MFDSDDGQKKRGLDKIKKSGTPKVQISSPSGKTDNGPGLDWIKNPELITSILDGFHGCVFVFDLNYGLLYTNTNSVECLGYPRETLMTFTFNDLFQMEQRFVDIENLFQKIIKEKNVKLKGNLIHQDQNLINLEISLKLIESFKSKYILCFCPLETNRFSNKALIESERRFSTLMNNIQGMVYRCRNDQNWSMEFVSDGCEKLLGYSAKEITSNSFIYQNLIHKKDREYVWKAVQEAIKNRKPYQFVFRIKTAQGETKWIMERGVGVYSTDGDLEALEGFITDVTQQKRLETELYQENRRLREEVNRSSFNLRNIIGQSAVMQDVYSQIIQASKSNASIIVYGESGTGKELVAKAIHDMSDRQKEKFVTVNCGAIPDTLIESEFFGYKKGAFSGADRDKQGTLDLADNGTLFLDEIGEINNNMQIKLLRAIDGNGYTPIGARKARHPDVRIISATNRKLWDSVEKGTFRRDFFYRIHVIPIELPPLSERKEDIPLLVNHFLKQFGKQDEKESFPLNVMYQLQQHDWPGNVRELENLIHRYITTKTLDFFDDHIKPTKIPASDVIVENKNLNGGLKENLLYYEKQLIKNSLQRYNWHRGKAAKELGSDYRTLLRKMKKHNLSM
ncbi:MAG: sigma 54-interacting transcriptional regulator [Desulfobacula sp.]|nr:sigma 54-interacting transcriptional regulator [Desulfobacula sp.]